MLCLHFNYNLTFEATSVLHQVQDFIHFASFCLFVVFVFLYFCLFVSRISKVTICNQFERPIWGIKIIQYLFRINWFHICGHWHQLWSDNLENSSHYFLKNILKNILNYFLQNMLNYFLKNILKKPNDVLGTARLIIDNQTIIA